jgi:hexosaminidase
MGYLPLERCYEFEPIPDGLTPEQAKHVLGLEGNLWTEWAPQNRIDWQAFPRLCALAEVAWSPKDRRDWDDFSKRLSSHFARLDELDVAYRPANTQEQP